MSETDADGLSIKPRDICNAVQSDSNKNEELISDQSHIITIQKFSLAGVTVLFFMAIILIWRLGIVSRKNRESYKRLKQKDAIIHSYYKEILREKEEAEKVTRVGRNTPEISES